MSNNFLNDDYFKNCKNYMAQTTFSDNKLKHSSEFSDSLFYKKSKIGILNDYEISLYRSLKESVPIIDAAITKIIRLVGNFEIECENKIIEDKINNFFEKINVGPTSMGIDSFIFCYLNQLLTYGTAIGEIVIDTFSKKIVNIYNASLKNTVLRAGKNALSVSICTKKSNGKIIPVKFPDLIFVSTLNPEPGQIYGNSIMKGLPFLSGILLKIYETIGLNWERIANTKFLVNYKPSSDAIMPNSSIIKEQTKNIAKEWSKCTSSSCPTDFVAIGDLEIKAIGSDIQVIDSRIPVRQLLEQILSKLSIPPFLLGLSWSTTETMSEQQADILSAEIESYRRILNPVIFKICSYYLWIKGINQSFKINWKTVNLKDKLRNAQTDFLKAKTEFLYKNNKKMFNI